MGWNDYRERVSAKVRDETRAGILVGFRLALSDNAAAACAVHDWAVAGGLELWVVDDLEGLAPEQPFLVGAVIRQAFGLDGDHRIGLTPGEFDAAVPAATTRAEALRGDLTSLLAPHAKLPGEAGAWFVWSGPLCGGFLVKGVFRDQFARDDLWFESEAECRIYTAARGARQDQAPGGVHGVALFQTDYDSSKDPPRLTPELLTGQDDKLARAGLLAEARLFVLPHYD